MVDGCFAVWFGFRLSLVLVCREKQRKEASRLQTVNRKLTAMNKLLMEENDRLQKQVSHLVYENGYMRQQLHILRPISSAGLPSAQFTGRRSAHISIRAPIPLDMGSGALLRGYGYISNNKLVSIFTEPSLFPGFEICIHRFHTDADLFQSEPDSELQATDSLLKLLWHYPDAIMCCTLKSSPVFTFANQAGLDMLETTLVALQDITLEKILDDNGRKVFCTEFSKIMQQGFAYLPGGMCLSSMGRPASYDQVIAWKVLDEDDVHHCLAFMFMNWSFV
ncbi:homeobox-leucine zipper protein HOX32-like [Phalaenopsis equestris]|uniref:homeobox-leucine zipper protein HOX32-like n=1 Tax=Phalaenopsis equestris TaxID=78828 RepID=UPI0009E45C0A|nr:homeobox-leucine zipper protein HOX32-like [Phalaenopsis equestris]